MSVQSSQALLLLLLLLLGGCAHRFQLPMTADALAAHDTGPALVTYLSQPDASPSVCNLHSRGPHLTGLDADKRSWLLRGLTDGAISPLVWQRCADALLRSAPAEAAASLLDTVGSSYRKLLRSSALEESPAIQRRLGAMHQLYLDRTIGVGGHAARDQALFSGLRRALAAHRLGPIATRFGEELIATVELERGSWAGRAVDTPMIDALYAAADEKTLRRFLTRLPQPELRDQSRRRVLRLHIAASPFAEVRDHAEQVEEIVMSQGIYRLSPADYPPVRGWLDRERLPMRGVLVRQHLVTQTATLLGYSSERPTRSVLPELQLRGGLLMELKGISRPVTLCGPRTALDPSPCIAVDDVTLDNPLVYLDADSAFHFVDQIPLRDAVALARQRERFRLPVHVGGRPLLTMDWSLSYERPADLIFTGTRPGDEPSFTVDVDHADPARFLFQVTGPLGSFLAAVEQPDALDFHIISRGAPGYAGSSGSSGSGGSSGSECQNGGDGGNGGPGGPGGDGGNGGNITVRLSCGDAPCSPAAALLPHIILSQGGPGGPGGSGGAGGAGGAGGSGRSPTTHIDSDGNTVTDDPGCSGGSSGSAGSSGSDGSPGASGRPGQVTFVLVR